MRNNIHIMMYLGSLSIFLSFLFPLASSRGYQPDLPTINWIWSFYSHEKFADYYELLFGINIFTILLILICPVMVIVNTILAEKDIISKESYEKQVFTYSFTILFLTSNMLIILPCLELYTNNTGYFRVDIWARYSPSFGLIFLYLGVAMMSLGVLFSIKFTDVELYKSLIIFVCVFIYLINPPSYTLEFFITSFTGIIIIFFIHGMIYREISNRFLGFIVILIILSRVTSLDFYSYKIFLYYIYYFLYIQSLMPFYLYPLTMFYTSLYLPVFLFFAYLLVLYLRKKSRFNQGKKAPITPLPESKQPRYPQPYLI